MIKKFFERQAKARPGYWFLRNYRLLWFASVTSLVCYMIYNWSGFLFAFWYLFASVLVAEMIEHDLKEDKVNWRKNK